MINNVLKCFLLLVGLCLLAGCVAMPNIAASLIHTERGKQVIIQTGESHAVSNPKNKTDAGKTFEDAFKGDPSVDASGF